MRVVVPRSIRFESMDPSGFGPFIGLEGSNNEEPSGKLENFMFGFYGVYGDCNVRASIVEAG